MQGVGQFRLTDPLPNNVRAAAMTASEVKPNFFCNSLSGAEAPKVFIPIVMPPVPTYCDQPRVDACSTEMRAGTSGGITLSRYSGVCCSKISQDGMLTTRTLQPSAVSC